MPTEDGEEDGGDQEQIGDMALLSQGVRSGSEDEVENQIREEQDQQDVQEGALGGLEPGRSGSRYPRERNQKNQRHACKTQQRQAKAICMRDLSRIVTDWPAAFLEGIPRLGDFS
jgi:hypothetical protein